MIAREHHHLGLLQPRFIGLQDQADLQGQGASPHAIASTLAGYLGVTVPGGTIDLQAVSAMGGKTLESGGSSKLSERALRNFWNTYRGQMEL